MFIINPIPVWHLILLCYCLEMSLILIWGYFLSIFVKTRYENKSGYDFYNRGDYEPVSNDSLLGNPQYSWLLVDRNSNSTVKSETFYTNTGDWFKLTYQNGVVIKNECRLVSSYIMIAFCMPGGLMILGFNGLNVVQYLLNLDREFMISFFEISKLLFGISMWATCFALFTIDIFRSCRIRIQ